MTTRVLNIAPACAVDWQSPWPGLAAFEEGDFEFFKGRDAEIDGLMRLILREDLSLFSGVSGLGKTSLLRAGLFPRLRAADILPIYVRLRYDRTPSTDLTEGGSPQAAMTLAEQCFEAIRLTAAQWSYEAPSDARSGTMWEYVRRRSERFWGPGDRLVTPLLVFDQFEELFTHERDKPAPDAALEAFFRDISEAVTGSPPDWLTGADSNKADDHGEFLYRPGVFKVLLSFREDFFAHVVGFRALVGAIDHNHFRLGPMTFQQGMSVVDGGGGHLLDEHSPGGRKAICEQIVTQVAAAPTPAARTSATVDPALLSLFCRELNEKRHAKNKSHIDLDLVQSAEASRIIGDFYEACMNKVSPETRRFVEERLVLEESRTRESIAEEAAKSAQVPSGDIEVLIAKRILRRDEVSRRGQSRLELTHDVLVGPALEALQRRRIEGQRLKEERERRERDARERAEQERVRQARDLEAAKERVALLEEVGAQRDRAEREEQARREAERQREAAEQDRLTRDLELQAQRAESRTQKRNTYIGALVAALAVAVAGGILVFQRGEANREQLIATRIERAGDDSSAERPAQALARLADVMRADPTNNSARSLALDLLIRRAWLLPVAAIKAAERPVTMELNSRGSVMATADGDTVRLWEVDTGREIGRVVHAPSVAMVRFSEDDRWLVTTATDGTMALWNGETRTQVAGGQHPAPVTAVAFRPGGAESGAPTFATASADGVVRLWVLQGPRLPASAQLRHPAAVDALEFSTDGSRLLTVSATAVGIWDTKTWRPLKTIPHPSRVTVAHFSQDARTIVTGSEDGGLRLWDGGTGAPVAQAQVGSPIQAAVLDRLGRRLLVIVTRARPSTEPTAAIWNVSGQSGSAGSAPTVLERAAVLRSSYTDVDGFFVDDRTVVMMAAPDIHAPVRNVRLADARSGLPVQRLLRDDATAIRVSRSGRRLIVARTDGMIRVLAVRTALPSVDLRGSGPMLQSRFSKDGQHVLTASLDGTATIWDSRTRQLIRTFQESDPIVAAEFSEDEKVVLTTTGSVVRVWDARSGQRGEAIKGDSDEPSDFIAARLNATATAVVTASPRSARTWDAKTGRLIRDFSGAQGLWYAEFNPAGDRIVTASREGRAVVWDVNTGAPVDQPLTHAGPVFDARFSSDGRRIVTASRDGTAKVWSLGSGVRPIELTHLAGVDSAQFAGDSEHVITTSKDWTARIWTLSGGTPHALVLTHEAPVDTAQLDAGRGRLLTVSSLSGDVRVWDVATGQALSRTITVSSAVWFAQFSRDGQRIVAACDDGVARVFAVPSGEAEDARSWLRSLAETVSGYTVDGSGTIVDLDEAERDVRLTAFRAETNGPSSEASFRRRFLRWFFLDDPGGF